jgi:hypothetical protein
LRRKKGKKEIDNKLEETDKKTMKRSVWGKN